jgi:uncharacterized protein (DUF1778 family)
VAHKNVSEFLLDAGIIAANQTLADRTRFGLSDENFLSVCNQCEQGLQKLGLVRFAKNIFLKNITKHENPIEKANLNKKVGFQGAKSQLT